MIPPLVDGPILDGPILDGPILDGPILDGPLLDGPVLDVALHPPGCASPAQLAKRAVAVSGAAPQRAFPPSRVLDHG
jgi:hypothetical protein